MKKLEWIALLCLGLVIGTLLTNPAHAAAQQPAKVQAAQAQAVQAAISLLLTDDDNNQVFLPLVAR
ncbi:MAG: hypothetical protein U0350_32445 [Caldilineaceae bacterium]